MFLTVKYRISVTTSVYITYADQPDDPTFNPKLYVKSGWNPPWEDYDLNENLYKICQELLENFNQNSPQWKSNFTSEERGGLCDLKVNPKVCVLATDKNLASALVSTEWVENETLKHLNDTKSYPKVTTDDWALGTHRLMRQHGRLSNSKIKAFFTFSLLI